MCPCFRLSHSLPFSQHRTVQLAVNIRTVMSERLTSDTASILWLRYLCIFVFPVCNWLWFLCLPPPSLPSFPSLPLQSITYCDSVNLQLDKNLDSSRSWAWTFLRGVIFITLIEVGHLFTMGGIVPKSGAQGAKKQVLIAFEPRCGVTNSLTLGSLLLPAWWMRPCTVNSK